MSNQEPATILLIDDHPMLRTGVKQLISMAPAITVVGEASNGEQEMCIRDRQHGTVTHARLQFAVDFTDPAAFVFFLVFPVSREALTLSLIHICNDPCPCGSGKKFKKCCGQ